MGVVTPLEEVGKGRGPGIGLWPTTTTPRLDPRYFVPVFSRAFMFFIPLFRLAASGGGPGMRRYGPWQGDQGMRSMRDFYGTEGTSVTNKSFRLARLLAFQQLKHAYSGAMVLPRRQTSHEVTGDAGRDEDSEKGRL